MQGPRQSNRDNEQVVSGSRSQQGAVSRWSIALRLLALVMTIGAVFGAGYCRAANADTEGQPSKGQMLRTLQAADSVIGQRTLRRSSTSRKQWNALSGPNFSGTWYGRYSLARANCSTNVRTINFTHALYQVGGRAALRTSHDGDFSGQSRDRGRRLEFLKTVRLSNGAVCAVGVVYKDITNDRRAANTGLAASCGRCTLVWAARAMR
jgi:hypothetical protein